MKLWGVGIFALSLATAAGGLMTASCSDSNSGTQGDGGASQGCPTNAPSVGSACFLANGATCNYGAAETPNCECCGGGGSTYACDNGKWEGLATPGTAGAGTNAAPACPAILPEAGTTCSIYNGGCEGTPEQVCDYSCGSAGSQIATCASGGQWSVTVNGECADDGGTDAGDGGDSGDGG